MALAIDIMDGRGLSNKARRERLPKECLLVVHFIVGGIAVLMAKLGTTWSTSVYRGEWPYHTRSEAFKDKARVQLHSKSFGLKQLSNSCICKILKYKTGFILKFKVVCVATRTLVMNCYSHDLLVLS